MEKPLNKLHCIQDSDMPTQCDLICYCQMGCLLTLLKVLFECGGARGKPEFPVGRKALG